MKKKETTDLIISIMNDLGHWMHKQNYTLYKTEKIEVIDD